ncbi:MBL fold metallo-hydrolase [Planctomycetota bacterium]
MIKTLCICLLLLMSGSAADGPADLLVDLAPGLRIQTIEPGVYLVVHRFPGACNSLLVECGPQQFVWADTPLTNEATQQVHQWLNNTFNDPNLIQINTGFHNDNLAGNAYLIEQGIPCYGADLTVKLLAEQWPKTAKIVEPYYKRSGKQYHDALLHNLMVPPNRLYPINEGLTLNVGNETLEVFFPGASHALDNVVVYFPSRQLLYGGCMIKAANARSPGFTADADMTAWPQSLQKVKERFPKTRLVVPGHGLCGDLMLLRHTIELCDTYNRETQQ